ncbi:MAG: hypothetical protein ER33_04790 [Cyanobium sp. CACIAM 14]|nr:MAG: hypothetical protein ER33_04790 [Cyanobium sp. CACIAM 14]
MPSLVITAHAHLEPSLAKANVLEWLEELGMDVALGEAFHLVAFDGGDSGHLVAEVDFYSLDGGRATQVRWHLHARPDGDVPSEDLIREMRCLVEASPVWFIDAAPHAGS